jgi:leucyl aminopeptidase
MNLQDLLIAVPDAKKISIKKREMLEAVLEGAFLGNYIFNKYKKDKALQPLKKVDLVVSSRDAGRYRQLPSRIEAVCSGTILAREWINTPSNDKRPDQFTKSIVNNARKARLKVRVLAEKELRQEKCCGILAVGSGSNSSPAMIILEYNPKGASKTLGLVGKGVTFDSGGINLKSTGSIEDMKMDMSGAAAVAALLITAAKLKPELKIVGVIPVVENMPSGNAFRPGDIVKSYTGKTIEIGNTDAEGRLILIDALAYCIKKYKPDTLIDLATLTGACVVALGEKIAGVFSSEEKLLRDICASGKKTSERCWNLPMPDDYKELLKSDFADIKNISSSRWGGAITAALFLSEFIENTKWAHIDIAGPAYIKKANDYCGPGGTGFGVRLLCDLLDRL